MSKKKNSAFSVAVLILTMVSVILTGCAKAKDAGAAGESGEKTADGSKRVEYSQGDTKETVGGTKDSDAAKEAAGAEGTEGMESAINKEDMLSEERELIMTAVSDRESGQMRRPVSPKQPMWLIHIDSWNYADPQKIIDLIPEDIKPYVVFNISLSINWDKDAKKWRIVHDGYETAKSWLRTCADNQVWAMVQPASGGQCHFPDYDGSTDYEETLYAEFFRDYPNFLGFNYCEQFWGFDQVDFPVSAKQRYRHFANLLKLSNKYGGYLVVSWCGNQWSPNINPLAMIKQVPEFEQACRDYTENFILEEKYTQVSYIEDMESLVYGAYVSGYCGNFGVRYDESGWTDSTWTGTGEATKDEYRQSTGLPIHLERMALNGATVIDGPELIWVDDFKEVEAVKGSDGYTSRAWEMCDQFQNNMIDLFRKVLDGTIRIPDREEVIARTKVILINDMSFGGADSMYSTPEDLFEGLYRMEDDGNLRSNYNLYKRTGRYPTIPMAYALADETANSFEVVLKKTELKARWKELGDKVSEFDALFPEEYQGTCYVGRNENTWVTYNPFKNGTIAEASIPLKYNTCERLELEYSGYSSGLINEYADYMEIYLTNYDEEDKGLKTDVIKIYGSSEKPVYTYRDRGYNQKASVLEEAWEDGVLTLAVKHNGPLDILITCEGTAADRLTQYRQAELSRPEEPPYYTGIRQYEAELFDYKNIEENVPNGCWTDTEGFQGQGFLKLGTNERAAVRDTVTEKRGGLFALKLRYSCEAACEAVDLFVNDVKIATLSLEKTDTMSDWRVCGQTIPLHAGENIIELKAAEALPGMVYLDNFTISKPDTEKADQ